MARTNNKTPSRLAQAAKAIGNLTLQGLNELLSSGQTLALAAHTEIEITPVNQKSAAFYRYFIPLRRDMIASLVENYRRYFKLALAHPHLAGRYPHQWALAQLQPSVNAALEWIRDWYILACDGENQYVRRIGSVPFVPGQTVSSPIPAALPPMPPPETWRAPAWLFAISLALVGVGPLKEKHVPAKDSEERLGAAHTRLLLRGARRVFLWGLRAAIEKARNEETAAAGAIPVEAIESSRRRPNKRKGWQQRLKLFSAIQKILSVNHGLQGIKFCAELDKRHAPPLLDWTESGEWSERGMTWKEAWGNPSLRRKIRRVRQEAMKTR